MGPSDKHRCTSLAPGGRRLCGVCVGGGERASSRPWTAAQRGASPSPGALTHFPAPPPPPQLTFLRRSRRRRRRPAAAAAAAPPPPPPPPRRRCRSPDKQRRSASVGDLGNSRLGGQAAPVSTADSAQLRMRGDSDGLRHLWSARIYRYETDAKRLGASDKAKCTEPARHRSGERAEGGEVPQPALGGAPVSARLGPRRRLRLTPRSAAFAFAAAAACVAAGADAPALAPPRARERDRERASTRADAPTRRRADGHGAHWARTAVVRVAAVTVRYLTKRYIGEYSSSSDNRERSNDVSSTSVDTSAPQTQRFPRVPDAPDFCRQK
ncbi:Protein of unknown function [Gryllus bimaculatus]|nr:Protein of unknown function [Gryllus bimaculatus]